MQNQRDTKGPKVSIQAPWKSERFLPAVLLELSGDRSLVLWSDLTPACLDHLQDLGMLGAKAFAQIYDTV